MQQFNNVTVNGNKVTINGKELPQAPCKGSNSTIINGELFLDGYEFKNGEWKRTIRAMWHLFF